MEETLKTNFVFIDTSVFWKSFFAANSPFPELQKLCAKKEIQLVTTTITMREIEAQVIEHAKGQFKSLENLRSKQNALDLVQIHYDKKALGDATLDSVTKALKLKVSQFFETAKVTVLEIPDDATPAVIDKYFKREKPFSDKKKEEFRDAFVIEALKRMPDAPNGIYILTSDADFIGVDERFHLLESAEEFLSLYISHTESANFVRRLIDKNLVTICNILLDIISKLGFASYHGTSFDVGGLNLDILTVSQILVFNLRPRQAAIQLELVVLCEGDALVVGNEYGVGDKFESFSETLNLDAAFTLHFNEIQPDYEIADVLVNYGNPLNIDLCSL